jgi:rhodanese-related sulfurtransferase
MSLSRRLAVSVLVSGVALLGPACASGTDDQPSAPVVASASPSLAEPDAFADRMDSPEVVTINVHTPDEGSIAGTDLAIPFDQIATASDLPEDRTTPLAVYCRSGNMSVEAVASLQDLGFTDVVELDGGFDAWAETGRPLEPAAA